MGYLRPASLAEALDRLARAPVPILAGGTDFFPARQGRPLPEAVLDLSGVSELAGINRTTDGWRIGAATTWTETARAQLPAVFGGLQAAARDVGSVQIQNAATIGGNLCNASPAADGVPPLLAMNAAVELASATGRRRLGLADFLLGPRRTALLPGEIMTAILLPDHAASARSAFCKLGSRRFMVISFAMVAVVLDTDAGGRITLARVAVGACSPVAARLGALEAALLGRTLADCAGLDLPDHMLAPLAPIDDLRASASYRREAAGELIRRALIQAAAQGEGGACRPEAGR